ncbi:MarR family winged helix-turn-helix transcriptional regulator [Pediococcus ethanolidurans]|nr:MarR family transcriptional regulator [Pediococcus ethanolidurans]MBU7555116.1 winged helix DNA-binding protein [Pediococcus ethanolidurans]MCV3315793.1 winged helix DNA-binding protein [Pediococcus ethanolidurans]MCV3321657.1 winged helix DNA-binding protein [Pediococcus ethanolidurans]MCV3328153.1 winged helix DNA-binding protein [Pediococcus ethanolidurans]MCV3555271.1 winged helix DNA-binding protein [Pediococcus ethanolidurans]
MNEMQYKEIDELLHQISDKETHNQHETWIAKHAAIGGDPKKSHLTHNDLDILDVLLNGEKTVSEVVEAIQITQGGTSRRINHLERLALLEKFHQPKNKKTVYLKLTVAGKQLAKAHMELHKQLQERALAAVAEFSDADIQMVRDFLMKLINSQINF